SSMVGRSGSIGKVDVSHRASRAAPTMRIESVWPLSLSRTDPHILSGDVVQLAGLPLKLLAEVGMRDVDQRLRPLADRLAVQVRDPVLRHDVVYVVARRHHACAGP